MSRLGQINRIKHAFDKKILLTILNTLVFSKSYCCSNVRANASRNNVQKLQAVQNFACRITSRTRKCDHVAPFLKELRWLPVGSGLFCIVVPLWRLNVCRAVAQNIFRHNLLNVQKSVILGLAIHENWTYLFLKQQVHKELFITELQVYGIPLTRLLNFVGM